MRVVMDALAARQHYRMHAFATRVVDTLLPRMLLAGFIGSSLVELLLQLGYRVRVLDNLSTGAVFPQGFPLFSTCPMHLVLHLAAYHL